MLFEPRWYQIEAVDKTISYIEKNPENHPLIICPTGSGKSHIIAMLCEHYKDKKILVVSHVKEILEQNLEKMEELIGTEQVGVFSAGMKRKEITKRVTIAGIQSIYLHDDLFDDTDFIIVDEAHKIPTNNNGMYLKLFGNFLNCNIIGLTATGFRLGSGYLHKGEGRLFDAISYEVDLVKLIQQKFLSPLVTKNANNKLDTGKLPVKAGDFSESEMSKRFDKYHTTNKIIEELGLYKEVYKHWIIFAIDIEHATHIHQALLSVGIPAELVHSKRSAVKNEYAIFAYQKGLTQCLVSVEKMTTGFDAPDTDLIALVRPTWSPVLHVQMIGRGLRIAEGKKHCLVLDFAGNLDRLGPINDVHVPQPGKKGKSTREAPIKTCPECNTHVPAAARKCYICQYEFPAQEAVALSKVASEQVAIRSKGARSASDSSAGEKENGTWYDVTKTTYSYYVTLAGKATFKITYRCSLRNIFEYVAVGREGYAGQLATRWWNKHTKWRRHLQYKPPNFPLKAVERANKGELREVKRIYAKKNGGYTNVADYEFREGCWNSSGNVWVDAEDVNT